MSDDFQSSLRNDNNSRVPPHLLRYLLPLFTNPTGEDIWKLWCLVEGHRRPTRIFIRPSDNVDNLKTTIKFKEDIPGPASSIIVWKLNESIRLPLPEDFLSGGQRWSDFATELECSAEISEVFPQEPPNKDLHIVVAIQEPVRISPSSSNNLPRVSRNDTVLALYEKLCTYQFIQVRGTPGTGKSSLCRLLAHHITKHEPTTDVFTITAWYTEDVLASGNWKTVLERRGWVREKKSVIILDEAQTSYGDADLWNNFFKSIHEYSFCRVIIFASYGSPTTRIEIRGAPIIIPDKQRVTLRAIRHNDNLPAAGLLFTQTEFNDLVSVMYPPLEYVFDNSFFDSLFNLTEGHIGAITDFIRIILTDKSYREIRNLPDQSYTWTRFLQHVSPQTLFEGLGSASIFARGLPPTYKLQDPNLIAVFEAVLYAGIVTNDDFTRGGEEDAISQCFRQGWLHTDRFDGPNGFGYCFPSPLHRWYIEWGLWGATPSTPFNMTKLLDFVVTVIRMFSPQALATRRIGPAFIQRPPEAQYQDEFYRCCHRYSKGSLVTFPEYGTKSGRVDFYIPSKEWGIEVLRDGDQLEQRSIRFSSTGAYGGTMSLSDYIILDFRADSPKKRHSHISKLYHVVFTDDFHTVEILDNNLEEVCGGHFTLVSSS